MTEIEKLLAEAEAALEGTTEGPWFWDAGLVPPDGPETYADIYVDGGETIIAGFNDFIPEGRPNARFIVHARQAVPALIAALRAMQAETERLRGAMTDADNDVILAHQSREAAEAKLAEVEKERDGLTIAARGLVEDWKEESDRADDFAAKLDAAEATVATLTAQVEAMRRALLANLTFAEKIAEAADIDPEETALNVRVMPEGREIARRTWAEVIAQGRAALTTENQTNG